MSVSGQLIHWLDAEAGSVKLEIMAGSNAICAEDDDVDRSPAEPTEMIRWPTSTTNRNTPRDEPRELGETAGCGVTTLPNASRETLGREANRSHK